MRLPDIFYNPQVILPCLVGLKLVQIVSKMPEVKPVHPPWTFLSPSLYMPSSSILLPLGNSVMQGRIGRESQQ
jgi:hypothetical protein